MKLAFSLALQSPSIFVVLLHVTRHHDGKGKLHECHECVFCVASVGYSARPLATVMPGNNDDRRDIQHDLASAVTWAFEMGIADKDDVYTYGGSYGGYACLAGLAITPGIYS